MVSPTSISGSRATRLETEDGLAATAYLHYCQASTPPTTSIDLLKISKNSELQWHQDLSDDALLQLFEVGSYNFVLVIATPLSQNL